MKWSQPSLLRLAKAVYHRLPVSQTSKLRLRARLQPVLVALVEGRLSWASLTAIGTLPRPGQPSNNNGRDSDVEHAMAAILQEMAAHTDRCGLPRLWVALPILATGGAELAAFQLCRAARELRPEYSAVLLVTDRSLVSDQIALPPGVLLVVFDEYFSEPVTYERKQFLLSSLLRSGQPHSFHVINSEVAWHLILAEGERLQRYTRLYASIFAFQFAPNSRKKIGYAAYFLKKGIPHLSTLFSDNQRFLTDASREYELSSDQAQRLAVLYQPCRLELGNETLPSIQRLRAHQQRLVSGGYKNEARRIQVLWAGRLDEEKRVDLFLKVVRRCHFADFRVFGQVVLGDLSQLPQLPNLSYEGPFTSPFEWVERYDIDAFVFTSRWEGMPNILLEVGTLGIPIIAPTVGGVIELIDERTGYPLPEDPTEAHYERSLSHVASFPADALGRANALQDLIRSRHSWNAYLARLGEFPDYLPPPTEPNLVAEPCFESQDPTVSVIIPCFNQGHYLEQSVASALAAYNRTLEIIVVDDGSTDPNTARQLARAEAIAPQVVRVHRQPNQGLSGARNSGIALARGRYIQFLDADDLLAPGKIDVQVAQLEINPKFDVSVCNYLLCDEGRSTFTKTEEAIARFDFSEQDFLYRWERGFVIPIHAGLFRRSLLREHRFDTSARAKEDWLFWTHLSLAGANFGYIHGHWAIYRQHDSSMRRSYVNMGIAWLQAGMKLNEKVGHRESLFFESVVSWFEQCYRAHPLYRAEIAQRQDAAGAPATVPVTYEPDVDLATEARRAASEIIGALSSLSPLRERPQITVVVPIYGHFEYLQGCLTSLAQQGNAQFEVVCIDDASPDPRISQLIEHLRDRNPRLHVQRELANRGISSVQNAAVEIARGDYVAFLDCDDALPPKALEIVCATLREMPEVDYLFTDRTDINERNEVIRIARYGGYNRLTFRSQKQIAEDLLDGMVASHLKVIRRSVYRSVGGCDANHSGVQDWELALRISQNHKLYYLEQPLYLHRTHTRSVTRSDNVSQFRKTNIVLRQYLERWRSVSTKRPPSVSIFTLSDIPMPLERLKIEWKQGGRCVADLRGDVNIEHINYVREFNAYFDQIIWSDPKIPASLFGYLCDAVQLVNAHAKHSSAISRMPTQSIYG
jgi:glycosyltransferase involved in cell wall biosynthesis